MPTQQASRRGGLRPPLPLPPLPSPHPPPPPLPPLPPLAQAVEAASVAPSVRLGAQDSAALAEPRRPPDPRRRRAQNVGLLRAGALHRGRTAALHAVGHLRRSRAHASTAPAQPFFLRRRASARRAAAAAAPRFSASSFIRRHQTHLRSTLDRPRTDPGSAPL